MAIKFKAHANTQVHFVSDSARVNMYLPFSDSLLTAAMYMSLRLDFRVLTEDGDELVNFNPVRAKVDGETEIVSIFERHFVLFQDSLKLSMIQASNSI